VHWCRNALGDIVTSTLRSTISGYGTPILNSDTQSTASIAEYFGDFVSKEGNRQIPAKVVGDITPLALAVYYMDDGSLSHTNKQQDRAHFAMCRYDETSVDVFLLCLAKFGIMGVKYRAGEYWRVRLNADDAEKFFSLIQPYIPAVMQYKLPTYWRTGMIGWMPPKTVRKPRTLNQKIIRIEPYESKQMRYDIETETHNYFANGILVHNCNICFTYQDGEFHVASRRFYRKEFWYKNPPKNLLRRGWQWFKEVAFGIKREVWMNDSFYWQALYHLC
jgi:hypothetical protein